jgi:hypothetical protein
MTKIAIAPHAAGTGTAPSVEDVIEALPKWSGV